MSNEAALLPFWEHPDMTQLMEFVCCKCMAVFHLGRTKQNPYPFRVSCPHCENGIALPTQEKRDWLRKPKEKPEPDSSPGKPDPSTGSASC